VLYSFVFRIAVPVLTHEFVSAETVMEVIFFCQFSFRQGDTVAFTILVWFCGWSLVLVFLSVIPVLFSFVGTTVKHGELSHHTHTCTIEDLKRTKTILKILLNQQIVGRRILIKNRVNVAFTILVWFCGWSLVLVFLSVIPLLFSFVGTTVKHGGLTPPLLFRLLVFTAVTCLGKRNSSNKPGSR
jgi:uncharacterized protein (DUF697 family)